MKTIVSKVILLTLLSVGASLSTVCAQEHSVARKWNEVLLDGIRNDFARPTVHARNLFHTSVVMYDAWSAYDRTSETFFLGKTVGDYTVPYGGVEIPVDVKAAQEEAISYAAYRLLSHRFANSPGAFIVLAEFDNLMAELGYDTSYEETDYTNNKPAALGNYLAEQMIAFGLQDGSNELEGYVNRFYQPVNEPLQLDQSGNSTITDPNRWQPLAFTTFVDQSGNTIPGGVPSFLGPEWGQVVPFALSEQDLKIEMKDGNEYWIYHDPGAPPTINVDAGGGTTDLYKWTFTLVALWSSHLDQADGVMWDISPASGGNLPVSELPTTFAGHETFYDAFNGGDPSMGHAVNPATGQPYAPQMVPRGDYTRVLAEFWADGPDSETPPGHWFTILNYVNDHPALEKRFKGEGPILDDLEWDVKAYFLLGGTMHDAAITAWGVKGYYDYIRPISAIRYMASQGQSSDMALPSYSPNGIPLHDGYIELVLAGDPLAGASNENVGKIKIYGWKGHDYISDASTDQAGVGWILADDWWPYQRPSFVTPPFAGYVSGHSTFSRAAAEVMTLLTGDEYFPGGMGEFFAPQNNFLVFEKGPSVDVTLQWATYRDASDQTSLSRIWGGIHPGADDIPGRFMGIEVGLDAFNMAEQYFNASITGTDEIVSDEAQSKVFPNPIIKGETIHLVLGKTGSETSVEIYSLQGQKVYENTTTSQHLTIPSDGFNSGVYVVRINNQSVNTAHLLSVE